MPYRSESNAIDAPVKLLLITSRDTGRRVIPKGNPISGLLPHAAAADAMGRLLQDSDNAGEHIREIIERKHDADNIIREVLHTVRGTFLTPFDRGAIISLISALDDAIDEMQAAAAAIDLYEVTEFDQHVFGLGPSAYLTPSCQPLRSSVPLSDSGPAAFSCFSKSAMSANGGKRTFAAVG